MLRTGESGAAGTCSAEVPGSPNVQLRLGGHSPPPTPSGGLSGSAAQRCLGRPLLWGWTGGTSGRLRLLAGRKSPVPPSRATWGREAPNARRAPWHVFKGLKRQVLIP